MVGPVVPPGGGAPVGPGPGGGAAPATTDTSTDNVIIRGVDEISAPSFAVRIDPPSIVERYTAVLFQSLDRLENELAVTISEGYFADTLLTSSFSDFILDHLTSYSISEAMADYNEALEQANLTNDQIVLQNAETRLLREQNVEYNNTVAGPHNADVQAQRDAAIAENVIIQAFNDLQDANEAENLIIEADNAIVQACLDAGGTTATCGEIQELLPVEPHKELLDENVGTLLPLKDPNEGEILEPIKPPVVEDFVGEVRDIATLFLQYIATQKQSFPESDDKFEILVDTLLANFEQLKGLIAEERDQVQTQDGGAPLEAGIGAVGAIAGNNGVNASVTELMDFVVYSIALVDAQMLIGEQFLDGRDLSAQEAFEIAQLLAASQGIGAFINGALSDPGSVNLEDLQEFVRLLLEGSGPVALTVAQAAFIKEQETLLTIAQAIRRVEEAQAELANEAAEVEAIIKDLRSQGLLSDLSDAEIIQKIEVLREGVILPSVEFDPVRQAVLEVIRASETLADADGKDRILRDLISTAVSQAINVAPLVALQSSLSAPFIEGLARVDQIRLLGTAAVVNNLVGLVTGPNFLARANDSIAEVIREIENEQVKEAVQESLLAVAQLAILRIADLILTGAGRDIEGRITGLGIIDVEERLSEVTDEVIGKLEKNNLRFIVDSFTAVNARHVSLEKWLSIALDPAIQLVLEDSMFRGESGPASTQPDKRRPIEGPA